MNQAKPIPPPQKQTRPQTPTGQAVREVESTCRGQTPCGRKCVMNGRPSHRFHTCSDEHCEICHSPVRFGRVVDPLPPPLAAGWVKR